MEVRDRFQLWSWALRRKAAYVRRRTVLDTVAELKRRFKTVLLLYQGWKEEKRFTEMQDLIMNFDQGEDYKQKPKLSTMKHTNDVLKLVAAKEDVDLGIVQEENEEDLEQSTQKIKPFKMDRGYSRASGLHSDNGGFRNSLGAPLDAVKDEEEEEQLQLNTGERRELDNLSSKALQSKVVSDFLRKKELDGRSYEPDNWAPLEDQQSAVTAIEARWLSYMQR